MALEGALHVSASPETVEFAFTVENVTTESVELEFRSGLVADFVVLGDDEEVWRFSDGMMFTQALQSETLAPGEAFTYPATWDDPVPGEYEAVATLQTRNTPVEARASFSV